MSRRNLLRIALNKASLIARMRRICSGISGSWPGLGNPPSTKVFVWFSMEPFDNDLTLEDWCWTETGITGGRVTGIPAAHWKIRKFQQVARLCDVSVHTHGPFASMLPHSLAPTWCFANRSRSDAAWTLSLSVPVSVCWCCTCSLHWQVLCQGYWWRTRAFRLQHPLLKISPLSRQIWGSHICCNIIWYRVNFFFANILKSLKPPRQRFRMGSDTC